MPTTRPYVYIHWFRGAIEETGTVEAAKEMVLERYPDAFFADWEEALMSVNMPAWENVAERLRFDLDEEQDKKQDENKPIAYVLMQDRPLPVPDVEIRWNK